jgi:hypothetical protein
VISDFVTNTHLSVDLQILLQIPQNRDQADLLFVATCPYRNTFPLALSSFADVWIWLYPKGLRSDVEKNVIISKE